MCGVWRCADMLLWLLCTTALVLQVFEANSTPMFMMDEMGKILQVNQATVDLTMTPSADVRMVLRC